MPLKLKVLVKNATEMYSKYILSDECLIINETGVVVEGDAFEVDIKKEYRNKKTASTSEELSFVCSFY